jgi:hypothetical protein
MLSESDLCVRLRTLKRGESSLGLWLPAKDLSRITVLQTGDSDSQATRLWWAHSQYQVLENGKKPRMPSRWIHVSLQ